MKPIGMFCNLSNYSLFNMLQTYDQQVWRTKSHCMNCYYFQNQAGKRSCFHCYRDLRESGYSPATLQNA